MKPMPKDQRHKGDSKALNLNAGPQFPLLARLL